MPVFVEFDPRQAGLGAYGFSVGSAGIGLTCMGIVSGSGTALVKRGTDDWVTAETTVMTTPNANGFLCQQGIDLGSGVCLVNRRDNTGGTGRTHNVYRSTDSGATWALAQALHTWDIGADEVRRLTPFAILGNGNILIGSGYNDVVGASQAVSEIFRSSDSGATWSSIADLVAQSVFTAGAPTAAGDAFLDMIVLDNGTTVLGTYLNLLYRSTNSGVTWTLPGTGTLDATITSVTLLDMTGGTVLAFGSPSPVGNVFVYRSTDYGATWASLTTIASTNMTSSTWGRQNACAASTTDAFIVLDDRTNTNIPTVYYTEDTGATWTKGYVASGTVSGTALILPSDSHPAFFANGTFYYDDVSLLTPPATSEVPSEALGTSDTILCYDTALQAWSTWPSQNATCMFIVRDDSTGIEEVWAGGRDGYVRRLNVPVALNAYTGKIQHVSALGAQGVVKSPRHLMLYVKEGSATLTVKTYMDFAPTPAVSTTVSTTGNAHLLGSSWVLGTDPLGGATQVIKRVDLSGVGEFMTLEISEGTAGGEFTILGYEVLWRARRVVPR